MLRIERAKAFNTRNNLEEVQISKKSVVFIRAVAFIGLAFATFVNGWTASLLAIGENNGINRERVNALNSVRQNLFGETVFSAGIIDPEPQQQGPDWSAFHRLPSLKLVCRNTCYRKDYYYYQKRMVYY